MIEYYLWFHLIGGLLLAQACIYVGAIGKGPAMSWRSLLVLYALWPVIFLLAILKRIIK